MRRLLGAGALAVTVIAVTPSLAFADDVNDLCQGDPNCSVVNDDFGSGGSGIPGPFIAFFILVLAVGIAVTIYRVTTARDLARKAGLDEGTAGALALLEDNGLSAAYVASSLRQPAVPETDTAPEHARPAGERLAELQTLRETGAITEDEYAARRQAIIDSI